MVYTVKKLAQMAGVSVRTLHHYDEIGLLKPSFIKENGYRYYEEKELILLQQILFFRELDFPLDQIKTMIQSPHFNIIEALNNHKKLLTMQKKRLDTLLITIAKTINHMKNDNKIKDEELYDGLTDQQIKEYKEEARQRWGESDAYKQSEERTKNWTKADFQRVAEEGKKITVAIAENMVKGAQSKEVQELIAEHHKHIGVFYECSYEMYRGLGQLYVQDPRFTTFYEKVRPGLAKFMNEAITFYCDQHKK